MLEDIVLEEINKNNLIQDGDSIVVGVSGGPDSITLLDILIKIQKQIKFNIVVAHINHMIRADADEDQKYVEKYCKNNDIPFYVKKEKVEILAKNNSDII